MLTSARHALIVTMATGFWMGRRNGRKISLSNLQHWILNVLCAQQHTSRKGRRKSSENGIFNLLYFFFFAFCVCNFWENENDCAKQRTNQGRPCQGFHVYITKQLDLLLPVFFLVKDGNFLVIYGAQRPRPCFHVEMKPRYYVAAIQ